MTNTQEGNKIIAEYLGYEYIPKDHHINAYQNYGWWVKGKYTNDADPVRNSDFLTIGPLQYHTSWEALRPAWAKAYKDLRRLNDSTCHILINQMSDALVSTDIAKAHEVLIRAIKHINQ